MESGNPATGLNYSVRGGTVPARGIIWQARMTTKLSINSAARNAVWVYDSCTPPRFAGASAIIERTRAHERSDFHKLPVGADVAVERYGGAVTLRLDGARRRIYTAWFEFVRFSTDEEAHYALLTLWREVEALDSVAAVEQAVAQWLERARHGS